MAERVTVGQLNTKLDMLIGLINERHSEYEKNREIHIREHSDINALLRGRNGNPGIVEEVHSPQKFCKRQEEENKTKRKERFAMISIAISSFVAICTAVISIMIK